MSDTRAFQAERLERTRAADGMLMFEDSTSPYSAKVRAYLHYKQIPYVRIRLTFETYMSEIPMLVGMPIIPVLITQEDEILQDSTPIIELFEGRHEEWGVVPDDARVAAWQWIVEDFADEYLVRMSMHYRWSDDDAARTLAHRIARRVCYASPGADTSAVAETILTRQRGLASHLALDDAAACADLEAQLLELLEILEEILAAHPFLFGSRPSAADFAMYGQLWAHLFQDPASMGVLEHNAPHTCDWLEMIRDFGDDRGARGQDVFGEWLDFAEVRDTHARLAAFIGQTWAHVSRATAEASAAKEKKTHVTVRGHDLTFSTHHYRAWSFERTRERVDALASGQRDSLAAWLGDTDVWEQLCGSPVPHNGLFDGFTPPIVRGGVADNRIKHIKSRSKS